MGMCDSANLIYRSISDRLINCRRSDVAEKSPVAQVFTLGEGESYRSMSQPGARFGAHRLRRRVLQRRRHAMKECVDLAGNVIVDVVSDGQAVDPLAHAEIEDARVQTPDQF